MKTKEHTEVRDKVVRKLKTGLRYKAISKALHISVVHSSVYHLEIKRMW